jgi:hypothetical protein
VHKSLPGFLIGCVLLGVHSFSRCHVDFLLSYLKICLSWDWLNFRGIFKGGGFHLSGMYSFYPFPHLIMIYLSQFKFPYQSPHPSILKLIHKQVARVKCLALKMDHH